MQKNYLAFPIFFWYEFLPNEHELNISLRANTKTQGRRKDGLQSLKHKQANSVFLRIKKHLSRLFFQSNLGQTVFMSHHFHRRPSGTNENPVEMRWPLSPPLHLSLLRISGFVTFFLIYKLTYNIRLASSVKHIVITQRQATICYHTIITKLLTIFLMLYIISP